MPRLLSRILVCSFLLAMGAAGNAQANWSGIYLSPYQYTAEFTQVPDFDQRRDDLANWGGMYCVPTAAVNWLAYIARHGYPMIEPGSESLAYWHSVGAYDEVTALLETMGMFMGTDPIDGTGAGASEAGIRQWLAQSGSGFLITVDTKWLDTFTPRFDNIAAWVNQGVPVMGTVGWYDQLGDTLTRVGGHVFSVVGVQRNGTERAMVILDPADDRELDTQSAVRPVAYVIEPRVHEVGGLPRIVDKVVGYGSGYIDGYTVLRPLAGLATSQDGAELVLVNPVRFDFDPGPTLDAIAAPDRARIIAVAPAPGSPWVYLVTEAIAGAVPSRLWRFDPADRRYIEMAQLDNGTDVELDRFGRIYVLDGRTLRCFELDDEDRLFEVAAVTPPVPCTTLALDDVNDRLVVLCDGSVLPFDLRDLDAQPAEPIPAGISLGGRASIAVSPEDGAVFLTSDLSPAIFRLDGAGNYRAIGEGLLARPRDVSVGDADRVTVVDGTSGLTKVFGPDAQTGDWVEVPDAPFAGLALGGGVMVARSRTNFDPALHTGPAYRNVLPPDAAPAAVGDPLADAVPAVPAISGVAPNPFNPRTTVSLDLPREGAVSVAVHDLRGRLVRTLFSGKLAAGRHALVWEGIDQGGSPAASGTYLVRLTTADGVQQTVKITLSK
ncbi:MAG: T9SS type A sorting domain-containing protein [Krumholzibacteria bacterium]|nr:T9SS type A sorting domain-containing protein [Candidatus Krumholzibacteria bacterium]